MEISTSQKFALLTDSQTIKDFIQEIIRDEVTKALQDVSSLVREQAVGIYTRQETAKYLKCSLPTLQKMVSDGKLHPSKVNGKLLFRKMEVENLLSSQTN